MLYNLSGYRNNVKLKHRKGGLFDRIFNGVQFGEARKKPLKKKMLAVEMEFNRIEI